jgi:dUTP pyrophosphatase
MTAGLLKVKRVHPDAQLPRYQSDGAACFDLHGIGSGRLDDNTFALTFRTGLAFEIPPGWVMLIFSRSGHGFKNAIRLANCVGVIDSDYRGEVQIKLTLDDPASRLYVASGDRLAQAMLVKAEQWHIEEVAELSDTVRGAGGFGSTGA